MAKGGRTLHFALEGGPHTPSPLLAEVQRLTLAQAQRRVGTGAAAVHLAASSLASADLPAFLDWARGRVGEISADDTPASPGVPRRALVAAGLSAIRGLVASQRPEVHDRIMRGSSGLSATLERLRAWADAGAAVQIQVPVLPPKLQSASRIVRLVLDRVGSLSSVRVFVPGLPLPSVISPEAWPEGGRQLAAELRRLVDMGVDVRLGVRDGIGLCAIADDEDLWARFRLPRKPLDPTRLPPACTGCAVASHCPGPGAAYLFAHGDRGLRPFPTRPAALALAQGRKLQVWTDARREAARNVRMLVLRPTVHCNQDCTFCSANETTQNVWPDPEDMKRRIVRAAQRGVERVSFSGGEPTLSRHLPSFVAVAKQAGVDKIELVTNGVLLDRPGKVEALVEAGLTNAFVSLHAHDEALSAIVTNKRGDFAKTSGAIDRLVAAGVTTVVNHVVTTRNLKHLAAFVRFAHARWQGRVSISFAFVSPQFKALDHPYLMPRLSQMAPYLRRALYAAIEVGQGVVVGSRQGTPPCQLGEFAGWSDVLLLANEAMSEDAPQKRRGPQCESCIYTRVCPGVWRTYAARFGFDELEPIEGPPLTETDVVDLQRAIIRSEQGVPVTFASIPERLRRRELEGNVPQLAESELPTLPSSLSRTRQYRVAIAGTGGRAQRWAETIARAPGFTLAAAASPHAQEAELDPAFGGCPTYADVATMLDDVVPDLCVIASSTDSHATLVATAAARGIPTLVEKPLAPTLARAQACADATAEVDTVVAMAHNDLYADGLAEVLAQPGALSVTRVVPADAPDAPRHWSRAPVFETLYHLASFVAAIDLGATLQRATASGDERPVRIDAVFDTRHGPATLRWEVGTDASTTVRIDAARPLVWCRRGREITLDRGDGPTPLERTGSEIDAMLAALGASSTGDGARLVGLDEGVAALRLAQDMCDALAPALDRPGAPRHAASPDLRGRTR